MTALLFFLIPFIASMLVLAVFATAFDPFDLAIEQWGGL